MYDLADVLRTIIDKKKLDSLYQSLLPRNQQFLRLCLHQKEKIKAPKLDIDQWKGDKDTLTALLQSRGMLRLGKAICGQEPQFMWHLTHILDTGRGQVLTKYYLEKPIPNITSHLILQLKFAMNFMKKKAPRE